MMWTAHQWLTIHYDNLNRPGTICLYIITSILATAASSQNYPSTAPMPAAFLTEPHYDNYTNVPLPQGMSTSFKGDWDSYFSATSTTTFPYPVKPAKNTAITTKGLETQAYDYNIRGWLLGVNR